MEKNGELPNEMEPAGGKDSVNNEEVENAPVNTVVQPTEGQIVNAPETHDAKFESAKDFSREKMGAERKEVADAIRAERKEYFNRKKELEEKLQQIIAAAESRKLEAGEVVERIGDAEDEIEQKSGSFVSRILNMRKIAKLRADLGTAKADEGEITDELAELEIAKMEVGEMIQDRTALDKARKHLDDFYQSAEEAWNNYEDDREAGNILNIARERNAFVVHAFINPTMAPSDENGLIRQELPWKDKLDLMLAIEPTSSTSAVDKNHKRSFAPVGVIVGDGQVEMASVHDMSTRATGQRSRTNYSYGAQEQVRKQIDEALSGESGGWTEFVVSGPKVSGLFFKVEDDGKIADLRFGSDTSIEEIVQTAKERGLPLFAAYGGEFYEMSPEEALALAPNDVTEKVRVGLNTRDVTKTVFPRFVPDESRKLTAELLAGLPAGVDETEREALLERFMTDSPFQLRRFPEAMNIASRADGRAMYHLCRESSNANEGEKVIIPAGAVWNVDPLEATMIETIPGPTHIEHIVILDDGTRAIWSESRKPVSDESRRRAGSTYRQDELVGKQKSFNIGRWNFAIADKVPENIDDVIELAKRELGKFKSYIETYEKRNDQFYAEYMRKSVRNIAFFVRGIAEEAEKAGDTNTAEKAAALADEFVTADEYQSTIERRVSETGTFKITREELLGETKT